MRTAALAFALGYLLGAALRRPVASNGVTYSDAEDDLSVCPGCGGEADNGHDRCDPPSPYYCTKCERVSTYSDAETLVHGPPYRMPPWEAL